MPERNFRKGLQDSSIRCIITAAAGGGLKKKMGMRGGKWRTIPILGCFAAVFVPLFIIIPLILPQKWDSIPKLILEEENKHDPD